MPADIEPLGYPSKTNQSDEGVSVDKRARGGALTRLVLPTDKNIGDKRIERAVGDKKMWDKKMGKKSFSCPHLLVSSGFSHGPRTKTFLKDQRFPYDQREQQIE